MTALVLFKYITCYNEVSSWHNMDNRHITPRSLFNDLCRNKFPCDDDYRKPIVMLIRKFGTIQRDGELKWRNIPVLEVIEKVIETVEKLLWDSGEITVEEQKARQELMTQVYKVRKEVRHLMSKKA